MPKISLVVSTNIHFSFSEKLLKSSGFKAGILFNDVYAKIPAGCQ